MTAPGRRKQDRTVGGVASASGGQGLTQPGLGTICTHVLPPDFLMLSCSAQTKGDAEKTQVCECVADSKRGALWTMRTYRTHSLMGLWAVEP